MERALKRKSQNHRVDVDLLVHYDQRQDTQGVMFLNAGVDLKEGFQDQGCQLPKTANSVLLSPCQQPVFLCASMPQHEMERNIW